jgi:MraZ protein
MALFVGRHLNKIDRKGRVSVPKPFRAALGNPDFSGIYSFPIFKFPAVEACDEATMQRIVDGLDRLPMFSDDQDDLAVIVENAHSLPFDPEGRVALPKELLEQAQLGDEALFVGRGSRFQIWQPAAYEAHRGDAFARAKTRGVTLTLKPEGEGR